MAATHATVVAQASASNAAAATTTGSWIDLRDAYKAGILARVTNGGTGPTVGCTISIDLSPDNGTTVYAGAGGSYLAGITASTPYSVDFPLPEETMYARVVFAGNTGQAVTVQADAVKLTGI
jgi:hypothetical protein